MSLPLKKLYIDTRYRTIDSTSTSNFKIELPITLYMPNNTVFYISDVAIEHSWRTVERGINDKLYIQYNLQGGSYIDRVITLTAKNYTGDTLKDELQAKLNALISNVFTVVHDSNASTLTITSVGYLFKFLTDWDLAAITTWTGPDYDKNNPQTCNEIIRNSEELPNGTIYESGFLDLQQVRNIYITSPNLGTFTTLGPRGESNILKKIPVNAGFGYMVFDAVVGPHDYLECSRQTLRTLEFNIRDVRGHHIPLHGAHVSFSVVFSASKEDI